MAYTTRVQSKVEQWKGPEYTWITVRKVRAFRNAAFIGAMYTGHRDEKLIILKKHPFIAETDKGCFQWVDLYLWNVKKVDTIDDDYEFYYKERFFREKDETSG